VVRRRRMVRTFADRPLSPELVDRILTNALHAPSAGFAQGWAFLTLTEPQDLDRFWQFIPNQVTHTPSMMKAPLVIVPLAHKTAYFDQYFTPGHGWENGTEEQFPAPYWYIDTAMATMLMLLTAVDEGLGGFFFWLVPSAADGFDGDKVAAHQAAFRAEFDVPSDYDPVGAVAIGHRPDDLPPQNPQTADRRRGLDVVVHRGQWDRH
jgi:nitroreductase